MATKAPQEQPKTPSTPMENSHGNLKRKQDVDIKVNEQEDGKVKFHRQGRLWAFGSCDCGKDCDLIHYLGKGVSKRGDRRKFLGCIVRLLEWNTTWPPRNQEGYYKRFDNEKEPIGELIPGDNRLMVFESAAVNQFMVASNCFRKQSRTTPEKHKNLCKNRYYKFKDHKPVAGTNLDEFFD